MLHKALTLASSLLSVAECHGAPPALWPQQPRAITNPVENLLLKIDVVAQCSTGWHVPIPLPSHIRCTCVLCKQALATVPNTMHREHSGHLGVDVLSGNDQEGGALEYCIDIGEGKSGLESGADKVVERGHGHFLTLNIEGHRGQQGLCLGIELVIIRNPELMPDEL